MQESLLMLGAEPEVRLGELVDGVRFFGEVPTSEFITGNALASAIGLTAGNAIHSNEPWLKFELDGKTLYVAKKPYRSSVSWDALNARGAVFGDIAVIIRGDTYKVRLLKGADVNPTSVTAGYDPVGTSDSEWNRLIYNVHNGEHANSNILTPPGHWPLYSDTDLVVHTNAGSGRRSWCQETNASNTNQRVCRGNHSVAGFNFDTSSYVHMYVGWRPVLELVP